LHQGGSRRNKTLLHPASHPIKTVNSEPRQASWFPRHHVLHKLQLHPHQDRRGNSEPRQASWFQLALRRQSSHKQQIKANI
jgi:hypothetical protein